MNNQKRMKLGRGMKIIPMPKFKTDIANEICDTVIQTAKSGRVPVTLFVNWYSVEQLRDGAKHSAFYERPFRYEPERFMGMRIFIDHSLQDGEFKIRNR